MNLLVVPPNSVHASSQHFHRTFQNLPHASKLREDTPSLRRALCEKYIKIILRFKLSLQKACACLPGGGLLSGPATQTQNISRKNKNTRKQASMIS